MTNCLGKIEAQASHCALVWVLYLWGFFLRSWRLQNIESTAKYRLTMAVWEGLDTAYEENETSELTDLCRAYSSETALQWASLSIRVLGNCQVMKDKSSEQCSLGCKESDYTNLIINKTYLRGITLFCGTRICSVHFSLAEVHQKPSIASLVWQYIHWQLRQLLTLLWALEEQPSSPLHSQSSQSSCRLSAAPHISKERSRWQKLWNVQRNYRDSAWWNRG